MNGGYILVDCKKLDLTLGSTPQTIDGLYESLERAMSTGKEIIATNCIWGDGLDVTPISILACTPAGEGTIVATACTLQVWVTDEDSVTIVNLVE